MPTITEPATPTFELDERDHKRGCPATRRTERYTATRPARPQAGEPAKTITVVRCVECGGHNIEE